MFWLGGPYSRCRECIFQLLVSCFFVCVHHQNISKNNNKQQQQQKQKTNKQETSRWYVYLENSLINNCSFRSKASRLVSFHCMVTFIQLYPSITQMRSGWHSSSIQLFSHWVWFVGIACAVYGTRHVDTLYSVVWFLFNLFAYISLSHFVFVLELVLTKVSVFLICFFFTHPTPSHHHRHNQICLRWFSAFLWTICPCSKMLKTNLCSDEMTNF